MIRKINIVPAGGAAAIGFAVMIGLGNAIVVPAGFPPPGTEVPDAVAFFAANAGTVGLASAFAPAAWVLATVFGAAAVITLWPTERGWALVGFAGLLLQNAAFTIVIALRLALASNPGGALWPLHDAVFTLNGTFLAIALTGLSVGGLQAGLIPHWHAVLGLVSAVLMVTSATLAALIVGRVGPLGLLGLLGWLLWVVWIAAWGVTLLRRPASRRGKPPQLV